MKKGQRREEKEICFAKTWWKAIERQNDPERKRLFDLVPIPRTVKMASATKYAWRIWRESKRRDKIAHGNAA